MRIALVIVICACSSAGLPPSQLPTETGRIFDEGSIITRKGTERFAVTERKGGGFILHTRFETYDVALELDPTWHPIGGAFGTARIELVDSKLAVRRDGRVLAQATGTTDLYIDPMSIAQFTPACSLPGDKISEFPDLTFDVRRSAGREEHDGQPLAIQTVTLSGNQQFEITCSGPKLLVFVGGGTVAYRTGYRDLAIIQSGGVRVP